MAHALAPPPGRTLILLAAACALLWFGNLEYRKLVRPDEGRYAEISREMAADGNWITPRLNGLKYFEKPPLQYWATAAAYKAFGEHAFSARLWAALTSFAGLLAVWFAGRRLFGPAAGLAAAGVLGSSLLYVLAGHINTLDAGLAFFTTAALCAFLLAQNETARPAWRRRAMLVAWTALGLGVLSKGLVALVLPAGALVTYTLLTRDLSPWKRLEPARGVPLLLLVCAPWFVAVSLANPEFPRFFFIHEHFERYLTTVHRRVEPWWYFLPILALGAMPWLLCLPGALRRAWSAPADGQAFNARRFLLAWIVFVFAFFSASGSKLPSYILPLFPALALLLGEHLQTLRDGTLRRHCLLIAALGIAALAGTAWLLEWQGAEQRETLYRNYRPWLVAAALVATVGACVAAWLAGRARRDAAVLAVAFAGLVAWQLTLMGHDELSPATSGHELARQMRPHIGPETQLFTVGTYDQTLPFYLKRTMTLVAFLDEMAFGAAQEPGRAISSMEEFDRRWRASPGALLITTPDMLAPLEGRGHALEVVARDPHRIVARAR